MRRGIQLGCGLAGVLLAASGASAQFASDRPAAPVPFGGALPPTATPPAPRPGVPALPSGFQPVGGSTAPTPFRTGGHVDPLRPVPSSIPDGPLPPHAWAVKAEHGNWMICVKSYGGPDSRMLAEKLAQEIREKHTVASYLFERNAEERAAEKAKIDAIRRSEMLKNEPLIRAIEQAKKEAAARGDVYIPTPLMLKIPKPAAEMEEQWAVLIGGFATDELARKALDSVRKLTPPTDTSLLDRTTIGGEEENKDGQKEFKSSWNYINPYKCALVVPNPAAAKAKLEDKNKLEPWIVKLNSDVPNSLLKAKKPWTIIVRNFSTPSKMAGKDGGGGSVFDRFQFTAAKSMLDVTAEEAERLAAALRDPGMHKGPFDAFVLHHRMGSIVTVGEFDGPDDPKLLETQRILTGITFNMLDKNKKPVMGKDGQPDRQRMFDSVSPFPVPKY